MATTIGGMTAAELLALPDDGIERDLIRGELREGSMTRRSVRHARAENALGTFLRTWCALQPAPRGDVYSGEAAFRIRRDPETFVGIDVAYVSAELARLTPKNAPYFDGVPVLAVEVLSPSDQQARLLEKIGEYLDVGVAQVWIVEPVFGTVTVYRPRTDPVLFNASQELTGDPDLPGFGVKVAQIFDW